MHMPPTWTQKCQLRKTMALCYHKAGFLFSAFFAIVVCLFSFSKCSMLSQFSSITYGDSIVCTLVCVCVRVCVCVCVCCVLP